MKFLLNSPLLYTALQRATGWHGRGDRHVLDTIVRPRAGERVLDLGCGTGKLSTMMPEVNYVGVDSEPAYIAHARSVHRDAYFIQGDAGTAALDGLAPFDLILLFGLLHHLSDEDAVGLLHRCSSLLAEGGRLVTVDNCRYPGQGAVERFIVDHDRGAFVRAPEAYEALAAHLFPTVTRHMVRGKMRFPNTLVVLECHA